MVCGALIVAALAAAGVGELMLAKQDIESSRLIYFAEWVALSAFGVAWMLAGVYQRVGVILGRAVR